jgi:hypothetical protein
VAGNEAPVPVPELEVTLVLVAIPVPVETAVDCVPVDVLTSLSVFVLTSLPVFVATSLSVFVDALAVAVLVAVDEWVVGVEAVLLLVLESVRT